MSISAAQTRAARGLLGWSQLDLAEAAKVGRATIADFESGKRGPYSRTLDDLRLAFETAGVVFVDENGEGAGVRLKKKASHADLTQRIEAIDHHLETLLPDDTPSPASGMKMLERGHKTEVLKKLKHRRAKLEDKVKLEDKTK